MDSGHELTRERQQFLEHKFIIQQAFNDSAFRKGTSLFRLGLVPSNVSDHLPIDIQVRLHGVDHSILCWNMLSDDHLFNNFMNVSGIDIVFEQMDCILREQGHPNIYSVKKMRYHLFAELSQFLYMKRDNERKAIIINESLLSEFCSLKAQDSRILKKDASEEQQAQVELARRAFLTAYRTESKILSHEVNQSIRHSLEMIYHIAEGALPWIARFKKLIDNEKLKEHVRGKKLLLFQELTNPEDMFGLFKPEERAHKTLLKHNSNPSGDSKDNCALIFDTEVYELIGSPLMGDVHRKPYIFAILKHKTTGNSFITSSIHHPGGDEDYRQTYLDVIYRIRKEQNDLHLPYIIAGDYNHTGAQFSQMSPSGQCGLIRLEIDPESLSNIELETRIEHMPCYAIFESKIYYICEHLNKTLMHTDDFETIDAIFPDELNVQIPASKEKLTQIESLTGHVSVANIDMSYPDKGSMAGNDYDNMNKAIDAVMSGVGSDNITVKTSEHLLTSRYEEQMPYSVRFSIGGKLEPHAGELKLMILPEDRTDSEDDDVLALNEAERTAPVTLTFG